MLEKDTSFIDKTLTTEYRPWGFFTILEEKETYKVKKLVVYPGNKLSLQLHHHRDEQWVVAAGTPDLKCDELYKKFREGECLTVPRGSVHRIENNSLEDVVIIEVQNGEYLGEDDIVRLQDDYSRV